jgi:hypothetical protein
MILEIIIMVIAIIFALGVVAEGEKYNKRTYCYGFISCVVSVAILEIAGKML